MPTLEDYLNDIQTCISNKSLKNAQHWIFHRLKTTSKDELKTLSAGLLIVTKGKTLVTILYTTKQGRIYGKYLNETRGNRASSCSTIRRKRLKIPPRVADLKVWVNKCCFTAAIPNPATTEDMLSEIKRRLLKNNPSMLGKVKRGDTRKDIARAAIASKL